MVKAMMSSRFQESTPVLSAWVVLAETLSCAHSVCCGSIRSAALVIKIKLVADPNYICPRCKDESWPIDGRIMTEVDVDGTMLDVEATFCYLGDMLCSGGGCDSAITARCCVTWGKFRKLLPVLTTRHLSPRIRGKVYEACVHSAMLHGSETWGPKKTELQRLRRNDRAMIRWICIVKNWDETPSVSLLQKLGIQDITSVLHSRRLRWYGHVQRATSCIKSITNFTLPGTGRKGGQRKTWSRCVKNDILTCGLTGFNPLDRDAWRAGVRHSLVLPTPLNGTWTAPLSEMDMDGWLLCCGCKQIAHILGDNCNIAFISFKLTENVHQVTLSCSCSFTDTVTEVLVEVKC